LTLRIAHYLLFVSLLSACGSEAPFEDFVVSDQARVQITERLPCLDQNPQNNAYFGDLHVHTALSNDGYSFGARNRPDDAYRFAFGKGAVTLPIEAGNQTDTRSVTIDRPLDFMAVTDHAEFMGEQTLCFDPDSGVADADFCAAFKDGAGRNPKLLSQIFSPFSSRDEDVCGEDGERCKEAILIPWAETIDAAEKWNDISSECERTAFIAYEYSSHRLGSNLHRNVIFRGTAVPERPISYLDAHREWRLWEILEKECLNSDTGCDVVSIPHNSNISNGRMFAVDYAGASSEEAQAARAQLRIKLEPVIEIMQHKGDSECRNGVEGVLGGEDELCNFEEFENFAFISISGSKDVGSCYDGPFADYLPHLGPNCLSRNSYVRYALIEGLKEEERIGVNPFKFGISASTDTHNGTGGAVSERNFAGHLGWADGTPERRVSTDPEIPGNTNNSPGGLIGVWAPENTRDAVFDSIQRKEVFGTSGPRIQPRLFAGWGYDDGLCDDPQLLAKAYAGGVPMGGDLPPIPKGASPVFVATAVGDAGTPQAPGTPLQRLQIVKGWYDEQGDHHQNVIDIAGDGNNGASVDLDTCETTGTGATQLCSVWTDPEFVADQRAVYYLRAVENPSCRYSTWQCNALPEAERPDSCSDPIVAKVLQERAWSSPIWYTPASM
jgi:hypothetical protein